MGLGMCVLIISKGRKYSVVADYIHYSIPRTSLIRRLVACASIGMTEWTDSPHALATHVDNVSLISKIIVTTPSGLCSISACNFARAERLMFFYPNADSKSQNNFYVSANIDVTQLTTFMYTEQIIDIISRGVFRFLLA